MFSIVHYLNSKVLSNANKLKIICTASTGTNHIDLEYCKKNKIRVISLRKEFNIPNLCLAGGVALNCVANGKILKKEIFNNIWIQPAAGDAGGSLGAALAYWHKELNKPRNTFKDIMKGSYLGPKFKDE